MRSHPELKVELARMTDALAVVEAHRNRVWARIEVLAEDTVTAVRPKARQFGRTSTTWTPADEREYQRQLERLSPRFSGERGRLSARPPGSATPSSRPRFATG
jgi:hypothetical protein